MFFSTEFLRSIRLYICCPINHRAQVAYAERDAALLLLKKEAGRPLAAHHRGCEQGL
jgi:hypothetical protein